MTHPCSKCGACCASFQASFHWTETGPASFHVPIEKTLQVSNYRNAMKGTELASPHCESLIGKVGHGVHCAIYENRPSCCRDFKPSFEDGRQDLRCEKARASKGIPALTPQDWNEVDEPKLNPFRRNPGPCRKFLVKTKARTAPRRK